MTTMIKCDNCGKVFPAEVFGMSKEEIRARLAGAGVLGTVGWFLGGAGLAIFGTAFGIPLLAVGAIIGAMGGEPVRKAFNKAFGTREHLCPECRAAAWSKFNAEVGKARKGAATEGEEERDGAPGDYDW